MKKLLLTLLLFSAGTGISAAKTYDLKSPDGKIAVRVDVGADAVTYSISRDGKELIAPSPLSLTLADGRVLGRKASVRKASAKSVDEIIEAPFYKRSAVEDRYNSLTLTFKGDYGIDFRAYDDGAAYRFRTSMKDEITVTDELVDIRFPEDFTTLVPYARDGKKEPGLARYYFNSFESTYSTQPVSKVADDRLAFLPILADAGTAKIVITEADLEDYPGMYLYNPTGGKALRGNFAPYPAKEVQGGHNELQLLVTEREDFIARTSGTRTFPWRVFAIAGRDIQLADNDMVYRLAAPSRVEDVSWIKPGKVAWDWWNTWNLYGVDFKSGINNETYKYYIDFAADHGIEYVILDEGWAVNKRPTFSRSSPKSTCPNWSPTARNAAWASSSGPVSMPRNATSNASASTTRRWGSRASRSISSTATTRRSPISPTASRKRPPNTACSSTCTATTSPRESSAPIPTCSTSRASSGWSR